MDSLNVKVNDEQLIQIKQLFEGDTILSLAPSLENLVPQQELEEFA
jgi:hypothetical protein